MGTISEKLTYLNGTKQELKQAINNLGGSITDETTFRQYVDQLDNVYGALPKTSFQEGTEVTIENGLKGKIDFDDGKVGFGQASQESTQGYNLLPLNPTTLRSSNNQGTWTNDYTFTINGITYTIDYDSGKVKVNGTASATSEFKIPITLTQGNTYRLSGCPSGGGSSNYRAYLFDIQSFTQAVYDNGSGAVLQSASYTNYEYRIRIASGYTANNLVFEPMVIDGSTAKTFEKYTGGYASPSPNWEQEVKYVRGKNRLNNTLTNKTQQGIEFIVNEDKTIKANGTATGTSGIVIGQVQLTANETYTLSGCASNGGSGKYTLSVSPNGETTRLVDDTGSGATYTPTTSGIYDIRLNYWYGFNIQNLTFKPMLEQGSQATSYLPYNTLEARIRGKNLAHIEAEGKYRSSVSGNFSINANYNGYIANVRPNTTYTGGFTNMSSNYNDVSNLCYFDKNMNFISGEAYNTANKTFTTPSNCAYVTMAVKTTIIDFQLEEGSTATDYEPYKTPRTYQFSLGNNKFYSIGDYADELLYDVDEDKVYKKANVGEKTFTESGTYFKNSQSDTNYLYYTAFSNKAGQGMLANNLTLKAIGDINGDNSISKVGISEISTNPTIFYLNVGYYMSENSVDGLKSFLNSNPITLYYTLATPTRTELTDTTLKQQVKNWYYSQSFNGTTIIESNGDLPMIIKVRALKGE